MSEFIISEGQDKKIFTKILRNKTKGKSPAKEQPHLVIVGGVPASGKTRVLTGYKDKNYVQIDIDSLRCFHPKFKEWKHDQMMAKWTNPCADKWYSRLIEECGRKGYNMVIETTLKTDEWIKVAGAFKNAGYKVDVDTIVCPIDQSVLSAHTRYEKDIADDGHGRYVFFSVVKDSYDGLPIAMDALAKSGVPGRCEIHSRRELLGVVNQNTDVQKIIAAERIRPKTADEYAEMKKGWDSVSEWMGKRGATPAEYEQLHDFIGGALSIMEKEGYAKENIDFLKNVSKSFENEIKKQPSWRQNIKVGDVVSFHCEHPVMDEQKVAYGTVVHIEGSEITVDSPLRYYNRDVNSITLATESDLHRFKSEVRQSAQAIAEKAKEQTNKVEKISGTLKEQSNNKHINNQLNR